MGGLLAIAGAVVLLAGGAGLLGGRDEPAPSPTQGAVAPTGTPTRGPAAPSIIVTEPEPEPEPAVTPWAPCAADPGGLPEVSLEIDGLKHAGAVRPVEATGVRPGLQLRPTLDPTVERIAIDPEALVDLWIESGACALAWTIELASLGTIDDVENPMLDPRHAAQNRFYLVLAPYENSDVELVVHLEFADRRVEASWPIRIEPIKRTAPTLRDAEGEELPLTPGCNITQSIREHYEESLFGCEADVVSPPAEAVRVEPGETLAFGFGSWSIASAFVTCGHLDGLAFVAEPVPLCEDEVINVSGIPFEFQVPTEPGRVVLALSACASPDGQMVNRLCGTWYAEIEVRE